MRLPKSKTDNLVTQEANHELLIYNLQTNQAFCLNETSALVWQFSNGRNSIAEIADLMSQKMKTLVTEEVVWLALEQLKKDNLLENGEDFEIDYHGLTRRQIIKKVGLGSMIALPLIGSVIAPTAANAQSGCLPPGTIYGFFCGPSSSCAILAFPNNPMCCSGPAIAINQPCPFLPSSPDMACACA